MIKIALLYVSLLSLIYVPLAHASCTRPWIIGVDDHMPFQGFTQDHQPTGLEVDLIKLAAQKMNCRVTFTRLPWKRQFNQAAQGSVDMVMGAGKRKERIVYLNFFAPYIYEPSVITILERTSRQNQLASLHDLLNKNPRYSVAALLGASYSQEFEDLRKNPAFNAHLFFTPSNEISMKMLAAGRVNAALFADPQQPFQLLVQLKIKDNITITPVDIVSNQDDYAYFAYSKKSLDANFAKQINDTILGITHTEAFDSLLRKYFATSQIAILKLK